MRKLSLSVKRKGFGKHKMSAYCTVLYHDASRPQCPWGAEQRTRRHLFSCRVQSSGAEQIDVSVCMEPRDGLMSKASTPDLSCEGAVASKAPWGTGEFTSGDVVKGSGSRNQGRPHAFHITHLARTVQ